MAERVRVLLVEDDFSLRAELRDWIANRADLQLVAEALSVADALVLADLHQPDAILFDRDLPGAPVYATFALLRALAPAAALCAYSGRHGVETAQWLQHHAPRGAAPVRGVVAAAVAFAA